MLNVCRERTGVWRAEEGWAGRRAAWDWLRRPGSLTAHLRELGEVKVEVLYEHSVVVGPKASALGRQRTTVMWTRDVTLTVDDRPAIVARTLVRTADSIGSWKAVRGLHDRPLATILYADPAVHRSPFEFCMLGIGHRLYRLARRVDPQGDARPVWARRSVFERKGTQLAVAECFLPWLCQVRL